ncbi:hypothetical protein CXK92_12340 [Stutzerimonas stutzeri]|uniref:Uncharacterized protein n=1 Tax=Stutzerimonas stutzeri TaxID=316 RepID=A0A2N8S2Y7_STUST|nr:hypothetical protein CXK92_12340 [Stutzerimonas stutzeri]
MDDGEALIHALGQARPLRRSVRAARDLGACVSRSVGKSSSLTYGLEMLAGRARAAWKGFAVFHAT